MYKRNFTIHNGEKNENNNLQVMLHKNNFQVYKVELEYGPFCYQQNNHTWNKVN